MTLLKKILCPIGEGSHNSNRKLVLELSEIDEITEKLVNRIEKKISVLKALTVEADQKIAILDGLITKFKNMNPARDDSAPNEKSPQGEVRILAAKGFNPEQIAKILDLPSGEVELILNLAP